MSDSSAPPAGQDPAPADANVGWEELTASNGDKYRVKASDYNIADVPTGEEANVVAASGPDFDNVEVNWVVGTEGAPSADVQNKTAITWYKLAKAEWYSPFQYKLTINVKDTYNYEFTDQEPDTYKLNVWLNNGTHEVEYRSDRPTIVKIKGT